MKAFTAVVLPVMRLRDPFVRSVVRERRTILQKMFYGISMICNKSNHNKNTAETLRTLNARAEVLVLNQNANRALIRESFSGKRTKDRI